MNIRTYILPALLAGAALPMAAQAAQSTATLHVQLIIAGACNVTTEDVDFGTLPSISAGTSTTGKVKTNCTNGLSYTITLGPGGSGNQEARTMTVGSESISYSLRHTSSTGAIWGNGNGNTQTVGGTGTGGEQEHVVYGVVGPQTTPPNGTYVDNLIVTVTW